MMDDVCKVPRCAGPGVNALCERHIADPDAPPMLLTCECPTPDVESLRLYGLTAAQCRRCGSPIEGTLCVS